MDYDNVIADETYFGKVTHYTSGRGGNSIQYVVLHHNGGFNTLDNIVGTFNSRGVSAHYQVDQSGRVGQYVYDADTAYHAGSWNANQLSIGIEHANDSIDPYSISEATLDAGAHLVAALCVRYGLGRPEYGSNVYPHRHFSSTDCPGSLGEDGSQREAYMARAQAYYDSMTNGTAVPDAPSGTDAGTGGGDSAPAAAGGALLMDCDAGVKTFALWATQLGLSGSDADGYISYQYSGNKAYMRNVSSAIYNWFQGTSGSPTVRAIQERIGCAHVDGVWGAADSRQLHTYMNDTWGYHMVVDDDFGPATAYNLQDSLNKGLWR
jgi:hypothetical protein